MLHSVVVNGSNSFCGDDGHMLGCDLKENECNMRISRRDVAVAVDIAVDIVDDIAVDIAVPIAIAEWGNR